GYGLIKYLVPEVTGETLLTGEIAPEIGFNYLGQLDGDSSHDLFTMSPLSTGDSQSPESQREHALEISGMITNGRLSMNFNYSRKQFNTETIEHLAGSYKQNLQHIITHCKALKQTIATPSDYGTTALTIEQLQQITRSPGLNPGSGKKPVIDKIYPLAPMQEGMLFHYLYNNDSQAYLEQSVIDISGQLDPVALEKALKNLVQRHDALRTLFIHKETDQPLQVVLKERPPALFFQDISQMPPEEKERFINTFIKEDRQKGFDLSEDHLLRVAVLQVEAGGCHRRPLRGERQGEAHPGPPITLRAGRFKLIWSSHHIILDGWCLGIVYGELFDYYRYYKDGNDTDSLQMETVYPYRDFIEWLSL
ncbi:MAG: hypothetical protein GY757_07665, partial [bacterium]|nr:hypothetical protein [bacterium]